MPTLIAFVSAHITLYPGDIISTGTPAGAGAFRCTSCPMPSGGWTAVFDTPHG